MLRVVQFKSYCCLAHRQQYSFSMIEKLTHYLRRMMNKVRWEENREFKQLAQRQSTVPKNMKEAEDKFISQEKDKSEWQKGRMRRIDNILNTKTHFHETKIYQERIDSDHLMNINYLERKNREPTREDLNYINPQIIPAYKIKNNKKHLENLVKLRTYPHHLSFALDFKDQNNQDTLQFLGKETLYTQLSLKPLDLILKSMEEEYILIAPDRPFESKKYMYFRPEYLTTFYRIKKELYQEQFITNVQLIEKEIDHIEEVISLDNIYNILKHYDTDERVFQYLKKIQNHQLQYIFSTFTCDHTENQIIIMIDLLGTKKQYCLLLINLYQKHQLQSEYHYNVLFNVRPNAVFSSDAKQILYIQRSEEGGWIELMSCDVEYLTKHIPIQKLHSNGQKSSDNQSTTKTDQSNTRSKANQSTTGTDVTQNLASNHENKDANNVQLSNTDSHRKLLYKCSPDKQLHLHTDINQHYLFLTISQYNQQYKQSLFLINLKSKKEQNEKMSSDHEDSVQLIAIDGDFKGRCKYEFDISPKGIIFIRYLENKDEVLKYGHSKHHSKEIWLVPYKTHIMATAEERIGLEMQLTASKQSDISVEQEHIPVTEFDPSAQHRLFQCPENQFIRNLQIRKSHLIMHLNFESTYNKTILYFLPFKPNAFPHSLIFPNGSNLSFIKNDFHYQKEDLIFNKQTGVMYLEKVYKIWKKELSDGNQENNRYYYEKMKINAEGEDHLEISVLCRSLFLDHANLPVVIYYPTRNDEIEGLNLRRFLQKGVMVVEFMGKGTFSSDLEHYLKGCKTNINNQINDLERTITFLGNNFSQNISLYCKGQISSYIGLLLNIRYPFLLNSTVLHNGIYDLRDDSQMQKHSHFFGNLSHKSKKETAFKFWDQLNPLLLQFKVSSLQTKKQPQKLFDWGQPLNGNSEIKTQTTSNKKQLSEEQLQPDLNKEKQRQTKKDSQMNDVKRKEEIEQSNQSEQAKQSEQKMKAALGSFSNSGQKNLQIGTLQNMLITSDKDHRNHSRKLIHKLRGNRNFFYEEVFLKEYDKESDVDWHNLSYIYKRVRDKLEDDINTPIQ